MSRPLDLEAERGVLGAILLEPESIAKCVDLTPEMFTEFHHGALFGALVEMWHEGKPMDAITIGAWLKEHDKLATVGGYDVLVELQNAAITTAYTEHYAGLVLKNWNSWQYMRLLSASSEDLAGGADPSEVGSALISDLSNIMLPSIPTLKPHEYAEQFLQDCIDGVVGTVPWWTHEWDMRVGKLSNEIVIVHAKRSTGKTAAIIQWIIRAHQEGYRIPFASIETTTKRIMPRFMSVLARVNTLLMRNRRPTSDEVSRANQGIMDIEKLGLVIRDRSMTIKDINTWAIMEKQNGADAIVIDNLLSISADRVYESKVVMYDHFLREFRKMRDNLDIPIIIIAHPNADGQVAWSRDAENFADIVLFYQEVQDEGIKINGTLVERLPLAGRHVLGVFQKNRDGIQYLSANLEFIPEIQTFRHIGFVGDEVEEQI